MQTESVREGLFLIEKIVTPTVTISGVYDHVAFILRHPDGGLVCTPERAWVKECPFSTEESAHAWARRLSDSYVERPGRPWTYPS